jgi:hypothetical protein
MSPEHVPHSRVVSGLEAASSWRRSLSPWILRNHQLEAEMLKKLMITTAAAALLTGSAFAQSPTPPASQAPGAQAPAVQQPAPAAQPKQVPTAQPNMAAAKAQFVTEQKADQFLATKFKGTDVIGANDEKIGDVDDILFDKDNKILAYVVGVGGFLGIGAKDVALAPASFQIMPPTDRENLKLKLAMTKDELKAAPEFKPYKEPARTTSSGPGAGPTTGQAPRDRAPATAPAERSSPPAAMDRPATAPAERMAPPPAQQR